VERLHNDIQLDFSLNNSILVRVKGMTSSIEIESNNEFIQVGCTSMPCAEWDLDNGKWTSVLGVNLIAPGCSELEYPLIKRVESGFKIKYDILGLVYWMLSRAEEVGRIDLDEHNRFPSTSSHAYKHNYLERPIVDEWLLILRQVIGNLWPGIELKEHNFKIVVSHDVDIASRYIFQSTLKLARGMVSDILKYGNFMSAFRAPWMRLQSHQKLPEKDPLNTFEWIMDQSDQYNLISSFNFISGKTHPETDADYDINHPAICNLLKRIHERGHEIGLHPSYNTYKNPDVIVAEANRLRSICTNQGIEQEEWGGRMHVLRWEHPTTLYGWRNAGMTYDSTLGYADHAGFRCGICFEYPAYDPVADSQLNLRIRPLIAMEVSVISKRYMGLGLGREAHDKFVKLKNACKLVHGSFTLLWHNNNLRNKKERDLYSSLLE